MIRRGTLLITLLFSWLLWSQNTFQLNRNASALGGDCYQVTDSIQLTAGSAFNQTALDLNQPFDINVNIMLGCTDNGADGMSFTLANNPARVGLQGGFLGIVGINPAFSVEFDTYFNGGFFDEVFDHMAISANGNVNHSSALNLAGPVAILPDSGNIEDCMYHDLRVTWDPVTDSFKVYFDCNLRISYQGDIATNFFNGNTMVFWGLTAGTGASGNGGVVNRHRFCLDYVGEENALRDTVICLGDTVDLNVGTGFSYQWAFAPGISDLNIPDPRVFPSITTQYTVTVFDECGGQRFDTILVTVETPADLAVDLGNDTVICPGQNLIYRLAPTASIMWNNMSTADTLLVQTAGLYWAEKTNVCGSQRDSVSVTQEFLPIVDLGNDTVLCSGQNIIYRLTPGGTNLWNDMSTADTLLVQTAGLYWAEKTNVCGSVRDSVLIVQATPPTVDLGNDTILCPGQNIIYRLATGPSTLWNDMSTADTLLVQTAGLYWAERTNTCGTQRDSVIVLPELLPNVNLGPDQSICDQNTVQLDATFNSLIGPTVYLWQDASAQPTFSVSQTGTYFVAVSNFCGTARDTVDVELRFTPPVINFGPDQVRCRGDNLVLNLTTNDAQYLWSDNSTGPTFTISEDGLYWGERFNVCGSVRDSIRVTFDDPLTIDLGPDQTLCVGEQTRLDMGFFPRTTYRWNNGTGTQDLVVTTEATYIGTATNACGSFSDEVNVLFDSPPPPVNLGADFEMCLGDTRDFNVFVADRPSAPNSYLWEPDGDTSYLYSIREAGIFTVTVSNRCGTESDIINVTTIEPPQVTDFPDSTLCEGEFLVRNVSWPGATYRWEDGFSGPERTITEGGLYTVAVENICGAVSDSFFLEQIDCDCTVYMPSAFSPNRDGINETFRIVQSCLLSDVRLEVYNRWGKQVFIGQGADAEWDGQVSGRAAPEGVYVWVLNYNGRFRRNNLSKQLKGTVTLLR